MAIKENGEMETDSFEKKNSTVNVWKMREPMYGE